MDHIPGLYGVPAISSLHMQVFCNASAIAVCLFTWGLGLLQSSSESGLRVIPLVHQSGETELRQALHVCVGES